MAVSVFHPEVVGGWRDDQPPLSTPGVVFRSVLQVTSLQRATNLVGGRNVNPRIAPHFTDPAGNPAYLYSLVVSSTGQLTIDLSDRLRASVNFTTSALGSLALVIRIGPNELLLPFSDVQSHDTTAPYVWTSTVARTWADTLSIGRPALVEVALIDTTAGNIDGSEVIDPTPRFIPQVAVTEPVSFFSEAALAFNARGLVWEHTRRNLVGDTPPVPVVDASNRSLAPAIFPISREYVEDEENAFVTRLDFSNLDVRLTVQSSPTIQTQRASDRRLNLSNLALAVRASGTGAVTWSLELGDFEITEDDIPGVYIFRAVYPPLTFRSALDDGAVTAVLVDKLSPNVDLANFQFRRLVAEDDTFDLERSSRRDGVRTIIRISTFDASGDLALRHLGREDVSTTVTLTTTPWGGLLPSGLPTTIEVREAPATGTYRRRGWTDRTAEFSSLSWAREVGNIAVTEAEVTPRDAPTAVYSTEAPQYLGRAIFQRFLDNGLVALTFDRRVAAADMRPGDPAIIEGLNVSPATTNPEFVVRSRSPRGAQQYSVFEGGDVGPDSVSGIRIQATSLAIGGVVELGEEVIDNVTITDITLTEAGISLGYEGTLRDALTLSERYAAFARVGDESWGVSLLEATVTNSSITASIPLSELGNLDTLTQSGTTYISVAVVERVNAAGVPNQRLNIGRKDITLVLGDSLLTAVAPASRGADNFAGLITRPTFNVTLVTAARINILDRSQRFEIDPGVFLRTIGIVTVSGSSFMRLSFQNWRGTDIDLTSEVLERTLLVVRHSGVDYRILFQEARRQSLGRYHIDQAAEGASDLALLAAALRATGAEDTGTLAVIDRSFYALTDDGLQLRSNNGDFYEVAYQASLVPRSRTVRYSVGLIPITPPTSIWDTAAASSTRGQYLDADPVGDATLESVAGVLMIQNDTVGFTDLNGETAYIHRLLISHSAPYRIVIQFSKTSGAVPPTPTTSPSDDAIAGLVLAFRVRRLTTDYLFTYTVRAGADQRDRLGERTIIDNIALPRDLVFTTAPDSFDLAVALQSNIELRYDRARNNVIGIVVAGSEGVFPQVAYGNARYLTPWMARDGSEFRVMLTLWPEQRSPARLLSGGLIYISLPGSSSIFEEGVATSPGTPIVAIRNFRTSNVGNLNNDETWHITTLDGSNATIEDISVQSNGNLMISLAAGRPGFGQFAPADLARMAVVFRFGGSSGIVRGQRLSDFAVDASGDLTLAVTWRAEAVTALTADGQVDIAFVDITNLELDTTDWTWRHGHEGLAPPLSPNDKILITEGAVLLDGADPRVTPVQIRRFHFDLYMEVLYPGGIVLTGGRVTWYREIDRRPVMGGWFINPKFEMLPGGAKQDHSMTCVDYSSVLDRRHHVGGTLVSREGEPVGEYIRRLVTQWKEAIPNGDEGIEEVINESLGGVLGPPFSTEEAGGTRSTWRAILDALQKRAQGSAGYHMDANKALVWREHGEYSGVSLNADADYVDLQITEDRERAANEVDVRTDPERTIIVSEEDPQVIENLALIEGGSGRHQIISDSFEGNNVGLDLARQHAQDQLARYPFQRKIAITVIENPQMNYRQVVALYLAVPGDVMRVTGPHLPDVPNVRTTNIVGNNLYVEPAAATGALPVSVAPGALLQIDGVVLEVVGGGGPRGSVWCAVPAGITMTPRLNTPARLIEQWLIQSVNIDVISSGGTTWREWTLSGTHPRFGSQVGRAQTTYIGQWQGIIRGGAR